MKTGYVSSAAMSEAMRTAVMRSQVELARAQKEMATLKVADTGLALGAGTAQVVNFSRDLDRLNGIVDSNTLVSARLSSTQEALGQLAGAAQEFLATLTSATSGDTNAAVTQASARSALTSLTSILNTGFNGEHLFAGTNTDVTPINSFTDPGSAAKAAFDAAFLAHFGFDKDAAAAATITAADMDTFITNVVEPQFMGGGWQANWSNATDQTIVSRIALNETTESSVSANNDGVRKLAMAAATIGDLFDSNLSEAGKRQLLARALDMVGDAVGHLTDLQAQTGVIESRVSAASERIKVQTDLFERHLTDLQGIDPYEASTRVTDLLGHIEASYALTARIQQLSLLKFL